MPLLNYTTSVPVSRTVTEVSRLLAGAGARAVTTRYDGAREAGLSFVLDGPHGERWFTMPVDIKGVHAVLLRQYQDGELGRGQRGKSLCSPEHAARVAWRIAREWLAVQLALVDARMASLDQVMLPYLHVGQDAGGREITLYDRYVEHEQGALAIGGGSDD